MEPDARFAPDPERFLAACRAVCGAEPERGSIGTLSEKTLHAVIKRFLEPDAAKHEIPVCGKAADVVNAHGIFEVQTRAFHRLRGKLSLFLAEGPVTVVYPIPAQKRLIWLDPVTGEASVPRKSPKHGSAYDAFSELYQLGGLVTDPSLAVLLLFIDMDEYRLLNGWSSDKKKGSTRFERIPTALCDAVWLRGAADYRRLLPESLPEPFTSRELAALAGIRLKTAQTALTVLARCGAIRPAGKRGRLKQYVRSPE